MLDALHSMCMHGPQAVAAPVQPVYISAESLPLGREVLEDVCYALSRRHEIHSVRLLLLHRHNRCIYQQSLGKMPHKYYDN